MKRDWELIREILFEIEAKNSWSELVRPEAIEGYSIEDVAYHIHLLDQAGLITAQCLEPSRRRNAGIYCIAQNMTWEGHELLDIIRGGNTWREIKRLLKEKAVDLSLDALKAAVAYLLRRRLS